MSLFAKLFTAYLCVPKVINLERAIIRLSVMLYVNCLTH